MFYLWSLARTDPSLHSYGSKQEKVETFLRAGENALDWETHLKSQVVWDYLITESEYFAEERT